jgi:hypothetical protein
MITLTDIWDKFVAFWEWIKTGFRAIKVGLQKIIALPAVLIAGLIAAAKWIYNHTILFITDKVDEMKVTLSTVTDNIESGKSSVGLIDYIENVNCIFPIDELLAALTLIFSVWATCLVVKIAHRLFKTIMEVIPG